MVNSKEFVTVKSNEVICNSITMSNKNVVVNTSGGFAFNYSSGSITNNFSSGNLGTIAPGAEAGMNISCDKCRSDSVILITLNYFGDGFPVAHVRQQTTGSFGIVIRNVHDSETIDSSGIGASDITIHVLII